MKVYRVTNSEGDFLMVAPMLVIAAAFGLRKEAIQRAEYEIPKLGYCEMFFQSRERLMNLPSILIHSVKDSSAVLQEACVRS